MQVNKIGLSNLERNFGIILEDEAAHPETKGRKFCKIGFVTLGILSSYVCLLPSALAAMEFNPFTGAKHLSAAAVVVNFGTFGADNYIELKNILFDRKRNISGACSSGFGKAVRIAASGFLGLASQFPDMSITLKIAPMNDRWRIPFAALGLVGACSPEIVSMYRTLALNPTKIREFFKRDNHHNILRGVKKNFLTCLLGARERLTQSHEGQRLHILGQMRPILLELQRRDINDSAARTIVELIMTNDNFDRGNAIENTQKRRTIIRLGIGGLTTFGSMCSLAQITFFSKTVLDYFAGNQTPQWAWGPSSCFAMTLAHTTLNSTFKAADRMLDTASGNKQRRTFSEAYYPKTDRVLTLLYSLCSLALYGVIYETSSSSPFSMDDPWGKTVFAGNYCASVLLIYYVMQSICEKGLRFHAESRHGDLNAGDTSQVLRKIDDIENVISDSSLRELGESFAAMQSEKEFDDEQLDVIVSGIKVDGEEQCKIDFGPTISGIPSRTPSSRTPLLPGVRSNPRVLRSTGDSLTRDSLEEEEEENMTIGSGATEDYCFSDGYQPVFSSDTEGSVADDSV